MANIVVSEERILQLEDIRIRLRDVLRSYNIVVSDNATIDEITAIYENRLGIDADVNYLKTGERRKIDDDSITSITRTVPSCVNRIKCINATTVTGSQGIIGSAISHFMFPNVIDIGTLVFSNFSGVNAILPKATTTSSLQPFANCPNLQRLITPKLRGFTYHYQLPALSIIDTYNGVPNSQPVSSLVKIIIRSDTLVSLSASARIPNIEKIYVPTSLLNSYKTATNWSVYADKIFALEGSDYEDEDWYESTQWYQEEMAVWQ